jgi:PPPDE putative peptidase domain
MAAFDKSLPCVAEPRYPSLEMSSGSDDGILCDEHCCHENDVVTRESTAIAQHLDTHQQHSNHSGVGNGDDNDDDHWRTQQPSENGDDIDQPSPESSVLEPAVSEYFDFTPSSQTSTTSSSMIHSLIHSSPERKSSRGGGGARQTNRVLLHIYDLIATDTLMLLPWGCVCEIGKCFNEVNSALHELGTGAYHVGVECNGIEYAYGACSTPYKSGVFSCIPKLSPGYQYRTSIDFGEIPLVRSSWTIVPANPDDSSPKSVTSTSFRQVIQFVDGRTVMKEMATEYMGVDYDILRRNCCTFAADACVRLGVPHDQIPSWFRNLAETGAYSQDVAKAAFVEPLQRVLSTAAHDHSICGADYEAEPTANTTPQDNNNDDEETGFEVIAKRNAADTRDVVVVIDADPNHRPFRSFSRPMSLAY